MRTEAPALLPILRSRHQADLLALLLLHPDQEYTLSELSQRLHTPTTTLHHEVKRLLSAGILTSRPIGRARLLRANADNRIVAPLTELIMATVGPRAVVEEEFSELAHAHTVIIYGSWARRYAGEPGPPPNDLDVLILGNPERSEVYETADRSQQRLALPVNPVVRAPERWYAPDDRLIGDIRSGHFLTVCGSLPEPDR